MCTVSWLQVGEGYSVFFNRDERRTRGPAREPGAHEREGVRFLAATDGDAGGSWLVANEYGVTLGLLNGYQAQDPEQPAAGYTSRGLLVTGLADSRSGAEVGNRLESLDLKPYRAFVLAVWAPDRGGPLFRWSAEGLRTETDPPSDRPLVSSSFEPERVIRSRMELFAASRGGEQGRLEFHRSHAPERGPLSPCMHRPDAHTVSFSRIRVDPARVVYDYAPAAPCSSALTTSVSLPRRDRLARSEATGHSDQ